MYNLACPASPVHYQYNPIKTVKSNVMGTLNMLVLARRAGARILQASTSEVYGEPHVHPQPESYWGKVNTVGPRSCYDEGKRVAETLVMDYHRQNQVDTRIARIFNTYGPRMAESDGRVVSNFIVQALRGEPLTLYGDGGQTRSFCYVDDLVEGLMRLMNAEGVHDPVHPGKSRRVLGQTAGRGHRGCLRHKTHDRIQAITAGRPHSAAAGNRARTDPAELDANDSAARRTGAHSSLLCRPFAKGQPKTAAQRLGADFPFIERRRAYTGAGTWTDRPAV